jgi:hypothetical protein
VAEQVASLRKQALARRCERHAAGAMTYDGPETELFFELCECNRHRRLSHVELQCPSDQAAGLGDGDEIFDLPDRESGRLITSKKLMQYPDKKYFICSGQSARMLS